METIEYALTIDTERRENAEIKLALTNVSATDLETLIAELQALREAMLPAVPMDPPMTGPIRTLLDPRYWIARDALGTGTLFGLRHPGQGWMFALIPDHERPRLIQLLQSASGAGAPAQNPPMHH